MSKAELLPSFFTLHFRKREVATLSTAHRYSLAILISLTALLLRMVMAPLWETTAPFALFMFATVVTAWQVGKGPAILTGAVGLATRLYFDSPRDLANYRTRGKRWFG